MINTFSLEIMECPDNYRMEERGKKKCTEFYKFYKFYIMLSSKNFKVDIIPYSPNRTTKVQKIR